MSRSAWRKNGSKALTGLAGTFGVSAEDVIRQSLPDVAVSELFFRCKIFAPELRWDEVSDVGRAAIREHLRATYMKGLEAHLARLGANLQSSTDEVEAAKQHALDELRADTAHPLDYQLAKAQEDSVYLGYLYDAWKRATGRPAGIHDSPGRYHRSPAPSRPAPQHPPRSGPS